MLKEKELKTFYIFLLSQFVSQFGSRLTSYGLILWAYNQSRSILFLALLSVSYLLPKILLNFIAGSISDRWNKKTIMLISDCIAELSSCFIIFLLITQTMKIEFLYIINIILGITDAFQNPASEVTISIFVSKDNYIKIDIVNTSIGIAGLVGSLIVARMKNVKKKVSLILNIMTFSFLICNIMLGIARNFYIWTIAVFLGDSLIPVLMANVTYIMRTRVPIQMQGRVFSTRNTLQYAAIPIGNIIGGSLSDKIFEPLMLEPSKWSNFFNVLVGSGSGSGIALLYICLGIVGVLGCWMFRKIKSLGYWMIINTKNERESLI